MPDRRSRMVSFRAEASVVERFHDRVRSGARSAYLETLLRWAVNSEDGDDGGRRERFGTFGSGFAKGFKAAATAALEGTLRPENLEAMSDAYLHAATRVAAERPRRLDGAAGESTSAARSMPRSESQGAPVSQGAQGNRPGKESPSRGRRATKVEIGMPAREPGPKD